MSVGARTLALAAAGALLGALLLIGGDAVLPPHSALRDFALPLIMLTTVVGFAFGQVWEERR